jgi:hypothetical protein
MHVGCHAKKYAEKEALKDKQLRTSKIKTPDFGRCHPGSERKPGKIQ